MEEGEKLVLGGSKQFSILSISQFELSHRFWKSAQLDNESSIPKFQLEKGEEELKIN